MQPQWFECQPELSSDNLEFISQFRGHAAQLSALGIEPAHTDVVTGMAPLVVLIEIPELEREGQPTQLQIAYWPADAPSRGQRLDACWGDDYLLEEIDDRTEPTTLGVFGLGRSPTGLADLALEWALTQLRTPIEKKSFRHEGRTACEVWRLPSTGTVVASRGRLKRRERRSTDLRSETSVVRDYSR